MSQPTTMCGQCTHKGEATGPLTLHGTCELSPIEGYTAGCALRLAAGTYVYDDDTDDTKPSARKARPNARKRAFDKQALPS